MSADKVAEAREWVFAQMKMLASPTFDAQALADAFIRYDAAVREDERARCVAAVMNKRPDVSYDRDDDHINQGITLALEAIRDA